MKKPELNEKMLQRVEEIQLATYKYLQALLEVDDKEMEALGLWNDNILQELSGYAMSILSRKNLFVCSPYIFEEYKIPYLCTLAECKCKKCVRQDEFMHKEQKVVSAIHRLADPDAIDIEADLALIAVVGRGMKSTRGTAGRIFSALAHANVNVKMIDQGSSELNIIIGVANADFETAIKAIYDIFVLSQL